MPTYLRYYEHRGYQVPAIAYVNQRSLKPPDQISWRAADVDTIHGKLCVLRMVGGPHSLALDWLKPLARNAKEEDIRVIAKQFLLLMNKIVYGGIEMDQMSEFHNYMSKKDGYAKLAKILSIMEPYSVFLSSELGKELHDSCTKPFGAPYLGDNDGSVVIDFRLGGTLFAIQVYNSPPEKMQVTILDKTHDSLPGIDRLLLKTKTSRFFTDDSEWSNRRCKTFAYPNAFQDASILIRKFIAKVQRAYGYQASQRET